jgi:hypothetical protein
VLQGRQHICAVENRQPAQPRQHSGVPHWSVREGGLVASRIAFRKACLDRTCSIGSTNSVCLIKIGAGQTEVFWVLDDDLEGPWLRCFAKQKSDVTPSNCGYGTAYCYTVVYQYKTHAL